MWKSLSATLASSLLLLVFSAFNPSAAQTEVSVPTFQAHYDVRINGIKVAKSRFSLTRKGDNEFLYEQNSEAIGIASWFKREKVRETSHWKLTEQGIQPVTYRYSRKGGSDDREVELIFDWQSHRVENRVKDQPWSMDIPDGALDKLVMQIAMLLDIQSGETHFKYPIADGGRLKHYEFKVVGEEKIKLPSGKVNTIKLARLDDDRDQTFIWVAPEMQFIPVRFLKIKKSGLKYEIRFRRIVGNKGI